MKVPPFNSNKIALFDMDGTLVDFTGKLAERLEKTLSPHESMPEDLWNMPDYMYERAQSIKREPGFWYNLPTLKWGWEVLDAARSIGFDIHVLTKGPTTGTQAWKEKADWVHRFMPFAKLHITEDKRIAYGRVFVDDYWPFMDIWLQNRPRGLGIIKNPHFHLNVVSYDSDGISKIKERLQEAFDRE